MKEELLENIIKEIEVRKEEIKIYNSNVKKIRELLKTKEVKEYLRLIKEVNNLNLIKDDEKIIAYKTFSKYLYKINKNETNKIFIYSGTYKYNYEIDIVHTPNDYLVNRNDPRADYRAYLDIEQDYMINIPIEKCEQFEKNNNIIYVKYSERYEIIKEFAYYIYKFGQEKAVKHILRKYKK